MIWNEITELVLLAQGGDRVAYGELVRRFESAVYGIALNRLRNAVEAQELAQEVFIHVWTKLGQLRDPLCFAGWLRQITVRMAINRLSRHVPFQGTDSEALQNTEANGETPLDAMVRAEQRHELWDSLKRLKDLDRDTLVAFYIRGHSLKKMARDFETPVGTIKRRLHVARNRLRQALERGRKAGPRRRKKRDRREDAELTCV